MTSMFHWDCIPTMHAVFLASGPVSSMILIRIKCSLLKDIQYRTSGMEEYDVKCDQCWNHKTDMKNSSVCSSELSHMTCLNGFSASFPSVSHRRLFPNALKRLTLLSCLSTPPHFISQLTWNPSKWIHRTYNWSHIYFLNMFPLILVHCAEIPFLLVFRPKRGPKLLVSCCCSCAIFFFLRWNQF